MKTNLNMQKVIFFAILKKHEPFVDIELEDLDNVNIDYSEEESDNNEFSMLNPDQLDLEMENNLETVTSAATTTKDNLFLPNDQFYDMCFKLNDGQKQLFHFVMHYGIQCKLAHINDKTQPDPFFIFLSGGAGVGNSYLVHTITEYLKIIPKYPSQNLDQPSVLVTASTGKAATGINGTTLHSSFRLPVKSGYNCYENWKLSDEALHILRNKYKYLQVLLIDEISIVGCKT